MGGDDLPAVGHPDPGLALPADAVAAGREWLKKPVPPLFPNAPTIAELTARSSSTPPENPRSANTFGGHRAVQNQQVDRRSAWGDPATLPSRRIPTTPEPIDDPIPAEQPASCPVEGSVIVTVVAPTICGCINNGDGTSYKITALSWSGDYVLPWDAGLSRYRNASAGTFTRAFYNSNDTCGGAPDAEDTGYFVMESVCNGGLWRCDSFGFFDSTSGSFTAFSSLTFKGKGGAMDNAIVCDGSNLVGGGTQAVTAYAP